MLCSFLYKGSWARLFESVVGGMVYKLLWNDINVLDLYILFMVFWMYVFMVLICEVFLFKSGSFTFEAFATYAWWSGLLWVGELVFIWVVLCLMSLVNYIVLVLIFDVVVYVGYIFTYGSMTFMLKMFNKTYVFWFFFIWFVLCNVVFMVKILK